MALLHVAALCRCFILLFIHKQNGRYELQVWLKYYEIAITKMTAKTAVMNCNLSRWKEICLT